MPLLLLEQLFEVLQLNLVCRLQKRTSKLLPLMYQVLLLPKTSLPSFSPAAKLRRCGLQSSGAVGLGRAPAVDPRGFVFSAQQLDTLAWPFFRLVVGLRHWYVSAIYFVFCELQADVIGRMQRSRVQHLIIHPRPASLPHIGVPRSHLPTAITPSQHTSMEGRRSKLQTPCRS